jgi:hypothetical protein
LYLGGEKQTTTTTTKSLISIFGYKLVDVISQRDFLNDRAMLDFRRKFRN